MTGVGFRRPYLSNTVVPSQVTPAFEQSMQLRCVAQQYLIFLFFLAYLLKGDQVHQSPYFALPSRRSTCRLACWREEGLLPRLPQVKIAGCSNPTEASKYCSEKTRNVFSRYFSFVSYTSCDPTSPLCLQTSSRALGRSQRQCTTLPDSDHPSFKTFTFL